MYISVYLIVGRFSAPCTLKIDPIEGQSWLWTTLLSIPLPPSHDPPSLLSTAARFNFPSISKCMIWIIDVIDALQLFCTLSRCFTWIILPVPQCPVWPVVENRWTTPSLQSLPYNKHQIPYWALRWHEDSDARTVSTDILLLFLFFYYHGNLTGSACVANLKSQWLQCLRRDNDGMSG